MKSKIDILWEQLESGKSFWNVVRDPFIHRDLNRFEVKAVISKALHIVGGKYINTLEIFNIERSEYKKLMKFLRKHQLQ